MTMLNHTVNVGKGNFHTLLKGVKIGTGHQFFVYISESKKLKKQKFLEFIYL